MTTVGLISPGDMGASVGAAATRHADVIWAGAERGPATHERAKAAGVDNCYFDRGGLLFHGRVKALADAAREGGLKF